MTGTPLAVEGLRKGFADRGATVQAVDDVGFQVREGEVYTLLGPSGCGKTSTLRAVAGLERPDGGRIVIDGTVVTEAGRFVPPERRDIGMVFQSYGIWPHMSVFDNAAFPLRVSRPKVAKKEIARRVESALAAVHLAGYESRMATRLSGGQQQRLALARALVRRPKLLLLDEPLSNLDAKLRQAMRAELASLQQELGITTLFVTHDQDEALSMSGRIAVMQAGRIAQEGTPREIYQRPGTRFVADFVGTTNFLEGTRAAGGRVETPVGALDVASGADGGKTGEQVLLAVRPEAVRLHLSEPAGTPNVITGEVERVMFVGECVDCHVRVGETVWVTRQDPGLTAASGDTVWLELPADRISVIGSP
ncbi:ABC transporter ATP-binding protein [Actinomadura macrotermitis]|uniref:Spermidine/putrescine import ATP-binding protein PotA n=1 Tax=Actinomadura macrotermitis TaxID=2585200 RepID=A0A7K0BZJ3_9ACTN|nr:ABC transporter ATP-binding protein [Actinomadura macrotermitis]MQY06599.1 Spermidine/putrescine import ATP-binding protein PotA [Actinomadura macrotermitis]